MDSPRTIHNLALVGFMGTGKTSVGRLVAEQLHFTFVDTDEMIERESGRPIADIFAQSGEPAFRQLERGVIEKLGRSRRLVISTGGGFITFPENLESLKRHALVLCLWASPETIWQRVRTQTHRPLLQTPDPLGKIRELLAQRSGAYHQADGLIHTGCRSPRAVVQQVIHQFRLAQRESSAAPGRSR